MISITAQFSLTNENKFQVQLKILELIITYKCILNVDARHFKHLFKFKLLMYSKFYTVF